MTALLADGCPSGRAPNAMLGQWRRPLVRLANRLNGNTKAAVVVFDDGVATVDAIAAASTNAGYPAQPVAN